MMLIDSVKAKQSIAIQFLNSERKHRCVNEFDRN